MSLGFPSGGARPIKPDFVIINPRPRQNFMASRLRSGFVCSEDSKEGRCSVGEGCAANVYKKEDKVGSGECARQ
jgi:hypothetical protein